MQASGVEAQAMCTSYIQEAGGHGEVLVPIGARTPEVVYKGKNQIW